MDTEAVALAEVDKATFESLMEYWRIYDIFNGTSSRHVWDFLGSMINRWAGPAHPGQHCRYGLIFEMVSDESIWIWWIHGTYPDQWDPVARRLVPSPENWGPKEATVELEVILGRKLNPRRIGRKEWRPED